MVNTMFNLYTDENKSIGIDVMLPMLQTDKKFYVI